MTKQRRLNQFSFIYGSGQLETAKNLDPYQGRNAPNKIHFAGCLKGGAVAYGACNVRLYKTMETTSDLTEITCYNCIKSILKTVNGMEVRKHPKTGKTICRFVG